jgi:hypothetical protein
MNKAAAPQNHTGRKRRASEDAGTTAGGTQEKAAGLPPEGGGLEGAGNRPALQTANPRTDLNVGHYKGWKNRGTGILVGHHG